MKHCNYISNWLNLVTPPAGIQVPAVTINSACRRLFLTSLTWDLLFWNTTTNLNVPIEANTEIIYGLVLGTFPPTDFASIMTVFALPAMVPGTEIILHQVGQYFYNDIRFDNQIVIAMDFANLSNANTYQISIHLHVETLE